MKTHKNLKRKTRKKWKRAIMKQKSQGRKRPLKRRQMTVRRIFRPKVSKKRLQRMEKETTEEKANDGEKDIQAESVKEKATTDGEKAAADGEKAAADGEKAAAADGEEAG